MHWPSAELSVAYLLRILDIIWHFWQVCVACMVGVMFDYTFWEVDIWE